MAEVLHREFVYIWYYFTIQLRQIFPYWVMGMVIFVCMERSRLRPHSQKAG